MKSGGQRRYLPRSESGVRYTRLSRGNKLKQSSSVTSSWNTEISAQVGWRQNITMHTHTVPGHLVLLRHSSTVLGAAGRFLQSAQLKQTDKHTSTDTNHGNETESDQGSQKVGEHTPVLQVREFHTREGFPVRGILEPGFWEEGRSTNVKETQSKGNHLRQAGTQDTGDTASVQPHTTHLTPIASGAPPGEAAITQSRLHSGTKGHFQ